MKTKERLATSKISWTAKNQQKSVGFRVSWWKNVLDSNRGRQTFSTRVGSSPIDNRCRGVQNIDELKLILKIR